MLGVLDLIGPHSTPFAVEALAEGPAGAHLQPGLSSSSASASPEPGGALRA
jgi:hypothetical protein